MARFTPEQQRNRSERFTTFLKDQGYSWQNASSKYRFIVYDRQELIKVSFTVSGRIYIVGRQGQLKAVLLSWLRQEDHRISDSFDDPLGLQQIKLLEERCGYLLHPERSLPTSSPSEHIPLHAILLDPGENQLAEVANLLGCRIYQCASSPRYLIISQEQQIVAAGDRLTVTIVDLVRSLATAAGNT